VPALFVEVLTWTFPEVTQTGTMLRMAWGETAVTFDVGIQPSRKLTVDRALADRYVGSYRLTQSAPFSPREVAFPKPPPERITLTQPVLNNARHVAFITTGAGKAEILPQILEADAPAEPLPAQRVRPTAGMVDWFVDEAAALQLKQLPPESD
jgi:hypothetical protein